MSVAPVDAAEHEIYKMTDDIKNSISSAITILKEKERKGNSWNPRDWFGGDELHNKADGSIILAKKRILINHKGLVRYRSTDLRNIDGFSFERLVSEVFPHDVELLKGYGYFH